MFQQQKEYKVDKLGLLFSNERLYVPEGGDILSNILMEFHRAPYSGHLRYQMIISTIKRHFFWSKLKADIAMFIAKCQACQLVKAENHHHSRLLQLLPILKWKWEVISMEFIISLWKIKKKNDSIFVVIDKLSKVAHLIPVKSTYKEVNIADIFLKEIFILH